MLSTGVLLSATAILFACWIVLSAWVLVERALHDRLEEQSRLDAAAFDAGRLDLGSIARRRLLRLALGRDSAAARAAAGVVLAADEAGVLSRARMPGNDNGRLRALTILVRGELPYAVGLIRRAVREGDVALNTSLLRLAAELKPAVADTLMLDILVVGAHPRSRTATELEPRTSRLLHELSALASHDDPALRYWAIMLLRDETGEAAAALAVTSRAGDRDANVRAAVAEALGGIEVRSARPLLRKLLRDETFFVRAHAARAVASTRDGALAAELRPLLADLNWWVRAAAKEALLQLGDDGLDVARATLDDNDRFARDGALEIILSSGRLHELVAESEAGDVYAAETIAAVQALTLDETGDWRTDPSILGVAQRTRRERVAAA